MMCAWLLNMSSRVFIDRYSGLEELASYSLAYKIASVILLFCSSFSMAFQPTFFTLARDLKNNENQLKLKMAKMSILFIVFGFSLAMLSPDLIVLFFSEKYWDIFPLTQGLILALLINSLLGISSNLYYSQAKKLKMNLYIVILSSFLNVVLNLVLIPKLGIMGAVYASILSFSVHAILHYNVARKYFFVSFGWPQKIFSIILGFFLIFLASTKLESMTLNGLTLKALTILIFTAITYKVVVTPKGLANSPNQ